MATYSGVLDLPLVAGHPALDLVNTVEPRLPAAVMVAGASTTAGVTPASPVHDHLAAPADLLVWARHAGLVDPAEADAEAQAWSADPRRAARSLAGVRSVREALVAVLAERVGEDPGLDPVPERLAELHAAWVAAAGRSSLRAAPDGGDRLELRIGARAGWTVLDRVAASAVDVLTGIGLEALRACPREEGGCGWVFLDRSRAGSRRWCVMADCGAKAKARRLADRRRAQRRAARPQG